LGLGLSIVEHLVEMHGGTVSAASPGVGQGATFTVELPLDGSAHAATVRPAAIAAAATQLAGKRVLVVDDDPEAISLLRVVLESADCVAIVAQNASEALERVRTEPFDALISDIGMPDVDGYTLIRRVRESERPDGLPLPAIALSAFARPEDRNASLGAGYDLHIAKPASPDEVINGLLRVLNDVSRLTESGNPRSK
jgi:CheY-like chemotaxis protein